MNKIHTGRTLVATISILFVAFPVSHAYYQTQGTLSVCNNRDTTLRPPFKLWGMSESIRSDSFVNPIPANAQTLNIDPIYNIKSASGTQTSIPQIKISTDGTALAYTLHSNTPIGGSPFTLASLNIVTNTGVHLSYPASANWRQLGPELSPGHFGILAETSDSYAEILDADWTHNQINVSVYKKLSFKLQSPSIYEWYAFISPGWEYIGYSSLDTTQYKDNFQIYSLKENKLLWQLPNITSIPSVIWEQTTGKVALIYMRGSDNDSKMTEIDSLGDAQDFIDLKPLLGFGSLIFESTETTNAQGKIALIAQVQSGYAIVILDTKGAKVMMLCTPDSPLYGSLNLQWINNGEYFSLQSTTKDGTTPSYMLIFSSQTTAYNRVYPTLNELPARILAWSSQAS